MSKMKTANGDEELEYDATDTVIVLKSDGSIKECRMPKDAEVSRGMRIAYILMMADPPVQTERSKALRKKLTQLINDGAELYGISDPTQD